jgi:hypothetical protein
MAKALGLKKLFKISNVNEMTWPRQHKIFLENAQGFFLKKINFDWLLNNTSILDVIFGLSLTQPWKSLSLLALTIYKGILNS